MLHLFNGSVFDIPAQTIVNTVNCVGVMGAGLAKECKARYPDMFREYVRYCNDGLLEPGKLHLWKGPSQWVLNFPTKGHWRYPSELRWLETGLENLERNYARMGITQLNMPLLGCRNGGLSPDTVIPLIKHYLGYKADLRVNLCMNIG